MNKTWQQWSEKFAAMTQREKVLISITSLAVIFGVLLTFWIEPLEKDIAGLQKSKLDKANELVRVENEARLLSEQLKIDPNDALRQQLQKYRQRITRIDDQIQAKTADLIPANQMADVLAAMLPAGGQLQLNGFESVTPRPLLELAEEYENINLYRHGLKLKISGRYFDVLSYMQAIEELPWQFIWGDLNYQVGEYPNAEVEILLYSISTEKEFIGV